jgi:hypothetical protein
MHKLQFWALDSCIVFWHSTKRAESVKNIAVTCIALPGNPERISSQVREQFKPVDQKLHIIFGRALIACMHNIFSTMTAFL